MRALLLACLALASGACAPASPAEEATSAPVANSLLQQAPSSTLSLIARIAAAPQRSAFHGVRRVHESYRVLGQPRELELLERVAADGQGRFALELVDLLTPALSPDEEELFALISNGRAGFAFRHRDFTIHSLGLFAQSYRLQVVGPTELLGRPALELEVRRRETPEVRYRIVIDLESALVLSSEERTLAGELISSMRFEEIRFEAPPAELDYYETPFVREPLDPDPAALGAQLGFQPMRPSLLPEGYRLLGLDRFEDHGRTWVRQVYGDGLEELFFLSSTRVETPDPAEQASAPAAAAPTTTAAGSEQAPLGQLVLATVGPWLVGEGEFGPHSVIAMGKLPEGALLRMVQSAVEPALHRTH